MGSPLHGLTGKPTSGASTVQFSGDNFLSVDLREGREEEEVTEAVDISLRFRTQEKSGRGRHHSLI